MKKSNVFIADRAPEFLRKMLIGLADQVGPENLEHPYLNPGAPRWMYLKLMDIYSQCARIREKCVAEYQRKGVTWLFQLDGKIDENSPGDFKQYEPECDYWKSSGYELANGDWNARLQIAPGTTRHQAIALTKGFINILIYMTNEDYDEFLSTLGPPRIDATINARGNSGNTDGSLPF